jgi:hypothetical protein
LFNVFETLWIYRASAHQWLVMCIAWAPCRAVFARAPAADDAPWKNGTFPWRRRQAQRWAHSSASAATPQRSLPTAMAETQHQDDELGALVVAPRTARPWHCRCQRKSHHGRRVAALRRSRPPLQAGDRSQHCAADALSNSTSSVWRRLRRPMGPPMPTAYLCPRTGVGKSVPMTPAPGVTKPAEK